jgi:hypothetical protein
MSIRIFILCLMLLVGFASCESDKEICEERLRGRIVSSGPTCAGVAIQVLYGSFQPEQVDATWQNVFQPNSTVYQNVFKTYPYCTPSDEQLKRFENIIKEGDEFYFIFKKIGPGSLVVDCLVCEPLVFLPEKFNEIEIVDLACTDI